MEKTTRLLAVLGFGGLGVFILACIFSLSILMIIGMVVFFGCVVGVVMYTTVKGYNPVEPY